MDREDLIKRYKLLKKYYIELKKNIKKIEDKESKEYYMLAQELVGLNLEIYSLRKKLIDDKFEKYYPTTILEKIIFGDEENIRGGR